MPAILASLVTTLSGTRLRGETGTQADLHLEAVAALGDAVGAGEHNWKRTRGRIGIHSFSIYSIF